MKFRIVVTVLIIAILGLFTTVIVLSGNLQEALRGQTELADSLQVSNGTLFITSKALSVTKDSLIQAMKDLKVYTDEDVKQRQQQLSRTGFRIGFNVQANKEDYHNLIAYTIGSGVEKLEYANKHERYIGRPYIYFYSEEGRKLALQLKTEWESRFKSMVEIETIVKGSSGQLSDIHARLGFKY